MTIWNQDEAQQFYQDNGYPPQYNDGLLAWLRDFYGLPTATLNDLLTRYISEEGYEFQVVAAPPEGEENGIVDGSGDFFITSDAAFIVYA